MSETPEYKFVLCPNYIRRAEGSVETESIACKMCGTIIAERMERTLGYETDRAGNRIKVVNRGLVRLPNYTEIKILFEDGSDHVTNGCSNCLTDKMAPEVLNEIHKADQMYSPDGYSERDRARYAVSVIGLVKGGGIV